MSERRDVGAPYKVLIWGPGGLGAVCIWETLMLREFELVGVRCYSDGKLGLDAGEFVGLKPTGIKFSNNVDELLALDADCVIYLALDMGVFHTDDEILKILESGKHLITPLPYQQAHLWRDPAFLDRLDAACRKGKTVFHATGVDPDTVSERIAQAVTGLCTDIRQMKLQEMWDCSNNSPEIMAVVGIGKSVEDAAANPMSAAACRNIQNAVVFSTANALLGRDFARTENTSEYAPAPKEIKSKFMHILPGQVARVTHRMMGYEHEADTEPFFTMEYNWFIDDCMLPEGIRPGQYFALSIEGRPSVKVAIDIKASLKNNDRFVDLGKLQTEPGYHSVIAACLQAVPFVMAAAPGLLPSHEPAIHWKRDLRRGHR